LEYIEGLVHEVSAVPLRHVEEHDNTIQALGKHIHKFQGQINGLQAQIEALRLSREELLSISPRRFFSPLQWISTNFRRLKREAITIFYFFNRQYRLVKSSGFDREYYLEQNCDVKQLQINPLVHYLEIGFKEGRNPNPLFDTSYYLSQNPDVAESGINPLVHYLEIGAREGRNPNLLIEQIQYKPKISIITPVYNVDEKFFRKCIYSVMGQIYNNWELCVVDHGSSKIHIKPILERCARDDSSFYLAYGDCILLQHLLDPHRP